MNDTSYNKNSKIEANMKKVIGLMIFLPGRNAFVERVVYYTGCRMDFGRYIHSSPVKIYIRPCKRSCSSNFLICCLDLSQE
jgi:hypothetical protein